MTDRIADIWGMRTPHAAGTPWPVRVDEYVEAGVPVDEVDLVRSACVLCSNGCGMDIGVHSGRIVGVRGRADDRHELIANGWVDRGFVDAHTLGYGELAKTVADYPPDRVAEICGVPAEDIVAAARIVGTGSRLVSTCLQGSTSRTRPPRRPVRSTTSRCCAG